MPLRTSGLPSSAASPASIEWDESLRPGDRFEVLVVPGEGDDGRLVVPTEIAAGVSRILDERGQPVDAAPAPDSRGLVLPAGRRWTAAIEAGGTAWLEFQGDGRFRLVVGPAGRGAVGVANGMAGRIPAAVAAPPGDVPIEFDPADRDILTGRRGVGSLADFDLALRAGRLAMQPGFDRLICLPMVREMDLLEHQTRTATTVLRRLRGRALLCDEVGLGKTIEAGLVLAELLMRGLARSVLVLTPPSLIEQWQGEMRRKFAIDLTSHDDPAFRDRGAAAWAETDRVIASIHTAKREPHRSAITNRRWDVVIVDEAHHLRNRSTQAWKFASALRKQFILLLTATPVQNNLEELFNLVTLLEPGLLSTQKDFARRFMDRRDKMTPKNVDELHGLLGEVMVRNRRSTVGLQFTRRWARTEAVALGEGERRLYDGVAAMVREHLCQPAAAAEAAASMASAAEAAMAEAAMAEAGAKAKRPGRLPRTTLILLQMALGSSPQAAAGMLGNLLDKPLMPAADRDRLRELWEAAVDQGGSAKADRLLRLIDEFPDKLVVFTQFRATQQMLARRLREAGHDVAVFHGGLARMEKEAAIEQFRGPARLLLCTEAGSEGRNLQFAHGVCNFDLPWNPMKIEQRIGRLSRIGQASDVHVFNLVARDTVEAAVLHLLEAKLNMFELVIGEVDMILGNLDEEKEFQDLIADEWARSAGADEFAARMEVLGNRLLAAKAAYFRQRAQDEKLFADRFRPEG